MIPGLLGYVAQPAIPADGDLHVLVVTRDPACRVEIAARLLGAGLRVTTAATFGVVEILRRGVDRFDLMATAQSAEETVQFGLPQLARSVDADLPILVLEMETADSPAVVDLVQGALSRWPLRERSVRAPH